MRARLSLAALAGALAAAPHARAQAADDGTIVVTASRTAADSQVIVADRDAIARRQPTSLLEILDTLPGVRAFPTGGPAGGSFLSIRGGEPNFTAVMLDGVRLNDPTNSAGGAFDFALLDPLVVERVEVSRVAASPIHGSDALSGVVQIVTRDLARPGFRVGGQGWLDSRYGGAVSASLSGGWEGGGVSVAGAGYRSGDGDPAGTLDRTQAFARARQSIGGFRLSALGLHAETSGAGFPEDSGGPLLASIRTREARKGRLSLAALSLTREPGAAVRPSLSLAWSRQHADSSAPAIAPGVLDGVPASTSDTRFTRLEAIGSLAADLGPLTLSAGGTVLREEGRSRGTLDFGFPMPVAFALRRVTYSGFGEGTLRIAGGVTLTGAARYDKLDGGSGNWTGGGHLRWEVVPGGPRLFAHVASGYKRPSLYALSHPLIGNPALSSETGRSIDVGIELPLPGGQASFALFDNRFRNLIDFDPVQFRLVNRDNVGARGVEGALRLELGGGWSGGGAITYLALDSATPLRGRPRWNGNLQLAWEKGSWRAETALRGNSAFDDSAIPTGARITAGHVEADAGLRYRLRDRLAIRLTLRNLGDNRSWYAVGTLRPGRSLRLSLVLD
ncbi:TonB-dependent receptor plug domain-containing protein [Sphingomonas sp. CJ20]